jgi:cytochrome P450
LDELVTAKEHDPPPTSSADRFCLGQNLARMELQIVLDTLFRRLPGLRLAVPVDDLPFKEESNVYGIYELPVTWEAK